MKSKSKQSKPARRHRPRANRAKAAPPPPRLALGLLTQRLNPLKIIRPLRLAELLSVDPSTIWRWRRDGILPPPTQISDTVCGWPETKIAELIRSRRLPQAEAAE